MSTLLPSVLLLGCTGEPPGPIPPNSTADMPAFALGMEYTEIGLATSFTDTGVRWAKTRLEAFEWGNIELAPPVGGVSTYDWSCTDGLVVEHQSAGMLNLQSYLSPKSPGAR